MEAFARSVFLVLVLGSACSEKPSAAVVNIVCPPFNSSTCPFSKPGPAECHSDSECCDSMKCCCSNCGLKCMAPVKVKTGRCPLIKIKCMKPVPSCKCHNDSDCPNLQKCCNSCGYKCMDPNPEPAGVCPENDDGKMDELMCQSVTCTQDSDCGVSEKCCATGGEQKCVQPVKPGKCPHVLPKCIMPLPPPKCQSDSDCPERQKCCKRCGKICMDVLADE